MAGEALGYIRCSCGQAAAIKKLKNSENLYSHCTKCGCDRRTGEHQQAQFKAAVGVMTLPEIPETIPETNTTATPQPAQAAPEWAPTPDTHKKALIANPETNPEKNPEKSENSKGRKIAGVLVVLLSAAGFIYKSTRG